MTWRDSGYLRRAVDASLMAVTPLSGCRGLGVLVSRRQFGPSRDVAPRDAPARCRLPDASSAALPERAFDIRFSHFGLMASDHSTGAFAHLHRALQPGGRVALVCWRGAA